MSPAIDAKFPEWVSGVLLIAVTVAAAGVGDRLLTGAGYPLVGAFFWVLCYAGALLVVWTVWLRHIEFIGPADG
jgi:hypothetical protein